MEERSDCASISMDLEPRDASRRVEVVARQLGRLIDVNRVSIVASLQGSPA
jgi:acetolactate synthase regulatory subunit